MENIKIDVLKVCCGNWSNASRDKRELNLCKELGYKVAVLCKGKKEDRGTQTQIEGYDAFLYSSRPLERLNNPFFNRIVTLILWAKFVKRISPKVVSGHDISGVVVAILARKMGWKGKIIYDSHEFELGRYVRGIKVPIWMIKKIERMSIRHSEFVISVNNSIRDELIKIYSPKVPVISLRSTPEKWDIDYKICEEKRAELLEKFDDSLNIKYLFMFHGLLGKGNGIEYIFEYMLAVPNSGLVLMGNKPSEAYYEELIALGKEKRLENRIIQFDAVPYEDIWKYVGAVDYEFMLIDSVSQSNYFCLPNKLFESIQSLTPIVSSDIPEMKRIVENYSIGISTKVSDSEKSAKKICNVLPGSEQYRQFKNNLQVAKNDLCWENEKKILREYYSKIMK